MLYFACKYKYDKIEVSVLWLLSIFSVRQVSRSFFSCHEKQ